MPKDAYNRLSLDDSDGWRLEAVWSRSGKRLGVSVSKPGDYRQMELTPDQVRELIDFLAQTLPDRSKP
jgi:hypothetical protein